MMVGRGGGRRRARHGWVSQADAARGGDAGAAGRSERGDTEDTSLSVSPSASRDECDERGGCDWCEGGEEGLRQLVGTRASLRPAHHGLGKGEGRAPLVVERLGTSAHVRASERQEVRWLVVGW